MTGPVWNDTRHRWEIDYYELAASIAETDRQAACKARRRATRRRVLHWCNPLIHIAGHPGEHP